MYSVNDAYLSCHMEGGIPKICMWHHGNTEGEQLVSLQGIQRRLPAEEDMSVEHWWWERGSEEKRGGVKLQAEETAGPPNPLTLAQGQFTAQLERPLQMRHLAASESHFHSGFLHPQSAASHPVYVSVLGKGSSSVLDPILLQTTNYLVSFLLVLIKRGTDSWGPERAWENCAKECPQLPDVVFTNWKSGN